MDNNITIQNTISIGIEIPPETFINEKTINVQNLIIESSSTNNGTICIPDNASNNIVVPSKKKKIFIVHGHDNEVKLEVARFIEKIGLEPIILHEQVNSGMTVIEKIEKYSDVEFGIEIFPAYSKNSDQLGPLSGYISPSPRISVPGLAGIRQAFISVAASSIGTVTLVTSQTEQPWK